MKIFILLDWKLSKDSKPWLKTELERLGYDVRLIGIPDYNIKDRTTRTGQIKLWFKYLLLAARAIKQSDLDDVIISLNFVVGSFAGFLCRLLMYKRKVISLNLIAHEKGAINIFFRKVIYNLAFGYKNFWFSVNDSQLKEYYSSLFKFPESRIFLMHDVYSSSDEQSDYKELDTYVFTGGEAFRDWANFIKCAEDMPQIQFIGVARKKDFDLDQQLPHNLKILFDIPENEFYKLLKESAIVFLPLLSLAPCGLIVLMRAALLSKPVIITQTSSTKNYIVHNKTGLLVEIRNLKAMEESIETLYNSKELKKSLGENLREYVSRNFSCEQNAAIINGIINS